VNHSYTEKINITVNCMPNYLIARSLEFKFQQAKKTHLYNHWS